MGTHTETYCAPRWELTGGAGGPDVPTVPGAARHLQPIRHRVSLRDGDFSVGWATLEAPLVMFGDLYLPYSPFRRRCDRSRPSPARLLVGDKPPTPTTTTSPT